MTPRLIAPGARVGDFEILARLGAGAMGAVYLARAVSTGALVALKVHAEPSALAAARFERERRVLARLNHPRIVQSLGAGATPEGLAWLAMEPLDGVDLGAWLARHTPSVEDVLAIGMQVCEALEHAHAQGVIHRDLKPANVIVCRERPVAVKVLDFGIAAADDEPTLTRTGVVLGTPSYMPPEQARGERNIDARADLWSLGAILFECLTGAVPFRAESVLGVLYQIVHAPLAPVRRRGEALPRALVAAVERCLRKSREERFATASELRAALAAARTPDDTPESPGAPEGSDDLNARTAWQAEANVDAEVHLAMVVCVREPHDPGAITAAARAFEGRVESLASGDLLVVFGASRWVGDEPARAARFAMQVSSPTVRVGVAAGRVLRGAARITGPAIDTASRLARNHEGVTVDAATATLVGASCELRPNSDGSAHVTVTRATTDAPPLATFDAPLFGRDHELARLLRSADDAVEQLQPKAVTVLGAAGIGKSRLRHEAVLRLQERHPGATSLVLRCEAFRRDTPFAALRDALARVVDADVTAVFDAKDAGGGDPVAALDRTRAALYAVFEALSERGPVALVIDDAQWLDPSSQATVRWVRERAQDLPLVIWVFGRPEATSAATELAGAGVSVDLDPLDRVSAGQLLRAVAPEAPEVILDRAGGNPLFIESLGRLFPLGSAADGEPDALPPSVEGACLTQLDQIPVDARELLKRAAVFGRVWWLEGVARLGGDVAALPRLRSAALVLPRPKTSRFRGAREFVFKVGVYQEIAYALLPEAPRGRLHAQAAQWLSEQPEASPAEVARHWQLADDSARAADAYALAAETASRVADVTATCAHAARALGLTRDPSVRWRALVARDDALQIGGDRALQREGIDEITVLAAGFDARRQTEAAWRRCYFTRVTADLDVALEAGREAVARAAAIDDRGWEVRALVELALLLADMGKTREASEHALAARDRASESHDGWLKARASATLGYALAASGDLDAVLGHFDDAAAEFNRAGDLRREAAMHANAGSVMLQMGRTHPAAERLEEAVRLSRRVGNLAAVAVSTHNLGVARRMLGALVAAAELQAQAESLGASLKHVRLASSVATERVYLALAAGEGREALGGLAREASGRAAGARSPALTASATAARLRVMARADAPDPDLIAAARGLVRTLETDEGNLELLVALWEADGRRTEDAAAVRAVLDRWVGRVRDPGGQRACRAAIEVRYLFSDELIQAITQ